jgi:hypothetical protein
MNALIIFEAEKAALRQLREKAAAQPVNILDVAERLKTDTGRRIHRRAMTAQTIHLPVHYFVTFSIETNHPVGTCRHMSMSSGRQGKAPTPEAVWMVCQELGFVGSIEECRVWIEDLSDGEKAINVVQPLSVAEVSAA